METKKVNVYIRRNDQEADVDACVLHIAPVGPETRRVYAVWDGVDPHEMPVEQTSAQGTLEYAVRIAIGRVEEYYGGRLSTIRLLGNTAGESIPKASDRSTATSDALHEITLCMERAVSPVDQVRGREIKVENFPVRMRGNVLKAWCEWVGGKAWKNAKRDHNLENI